MRIHMRPPLAYTPPAPPPKQPPTAIQLQMQAEQLTETAQLQKARLRKLNGARRNRGDPDEEEGPDREKRERDRRSDRDIDFLA
jgi:hypothetical protein